MKNKRGQQIPVRRPMIFDVLPPEIAPRLDLKPLPWRKRMARKLPRWMRHWWVPAVIVLVAASGGWAIWRIWFRYVPQLSPAVVSQIEVFTPYFFADGMPQGFSLNPKDTVYSDSVLFFQLQDAGGNTVVVSEQALPNNFSNSMLQGEQKFSSSQGDGAVADIQGRVIGTLVTKDKHVLVTVSASDSVAAGTIKKLVMALAPIKR